MRKTVHLTIGDATHHIGTAETWDEVATLVQTWAAWQPGGLAGLLQQAHVHPSVWHLTPRNAHEEPHAYHVWVRQP